MKADSIRSREAFGVENVSGLQVDPLWEDGLEERRQELKRITSRG